MIARRRVVVPVAIAFVAATGLVVRLADGPEARPIVGEGSRPSLPSHTPLALSPPPSSPTASTPPASPSASTFASTPGPPPSPTTSGPSRPASVPPSPATRAQSPDVVMDELLERDEPPPDGVAAQLEVFFGGAPECPERETSDRLSVRMPEIVAIPSVPMICVWGFDFDLPLTVTVTSPTGDTNTRTLPQWDVLMDMVHPLPSGSPPGRYQVHVAQDKDQAGTDFVARRSESPTMVAHPAVADVGSTVDVYLGGFPPGSPTDVHLYSCAEPTARYRATQPVRINADGEAHLALHTSAATESTCYILTNPLVIAPPTDPGGGGPAYVQFFLRPGPPS